MAINPKYKPIVIAAACLAAVVLLWVYATVDPAHSRLFPRCPVYAITGLYCPGCGSQRALHSILEGNLAGAWRYNAALFFGIPLVAVLLAAYTMRYRYPRVYRALNSRAVILSVAVLLTGWMVVRNIFGW